jgi:hypothetical protein
LRISKKVLRLASHVSLEIAGRPVPAGLFACHHCDNPWCVNPAHLFIGTQQQNSADSILKGRNSKPPTSKPGQGLQEQCWRGHLLSGDNLYITRFGRRHCRACKREIKRLRRSKFMAMGLRSDGLERAA